jgi:DNA-binding FrmR family transcriptional regulator
MDARETGEGAAPSGLAGPAGPAPLTESRFRRDNAALLQRLRKIEGQVRGVQRMVEDDRYCVDILVQLSAIRSAVQAVGLSLLESHVRGCVARALQAGDGQQAVTELLEVLSQFSR